MRCILLCLLAVAAALAGHHPVSGRKLLQPSGSYYLLTASGASASPPPPPPSGGGGGGGMDPYGVLPKAPGLLPAGDIRVDNNQMLNFLQPLSNLGYYGSGAQPTSFGK